MRRQNVPKVLLAFLAACLVAVGCGLPANDQVEAISVEGHEELLNGTTTTTEPEPEPEDPETATLTLFFIGPDSKLERVQRPFSAPVIDDVLAALEAGPIAEELVPFEERGILESRVPEGLSAKAGGRNPELGIQRIDVDPEAGFRVRLQDEPALSRLPVSQIVCTILNLPIEEVTGVAIYDGEEEPLQLSDNDAEPIIGPAKLEDFDGCKTGTDELLELEEQLEEAAEEEEAEQGSNDNGG